MSMAKTSSYQKLKSENAALIQDIYKLVILVNSDKPGDFTDYITTKTRWAARFNLEDQVWLVSPTAKTNWITRSKIT